VTVMRYLSNWVFCMAPLLMVHQHAPMKTIQNVMQKLL
jgi:hypothetical protein